MLESRHEDVTRALSDLQSGDRSAVNRVLPLIYDELRALAGSYFRRQRSDHTLQPTALVHEAFVRLVDGANSEWQSRKHFFDVAAMAMRQLLADHARRRGAAKRGGDLAKVTLGDPEAGSSMGNIDLVALDDALTKLSELDERQGRIVELRFLAGLSVAETAEVLAVSQRTVKLDWQMAKAWLRQELDECKER